MEINLYNDDCLKILQAFVDNSIDAIVTDPPYGIKFMGKKWDYTIPSVDIWKECLRVLKPGGHILVACGTRTQHRMACNIEDAGFEIRDLIAWIYGSGFPKSLNIGKAVDELQGTERLEFDNPLAKKQTGQIDSVAFGTKKQNLKISKGSSEWEGWGTGLKPAMELWTLARKPLSEKTVAENVLKWGVGGINIDGCRVETQDTYSYKKCGGSSFGISKGIDGTREYSANNNPNGRFPANVIHDGSEEVLDGFPNTKSGKSNNNAEIGEQSENIPYRRGNLISRFDDGSAARFFYCAKASSSERNENCENKNNHPTVKPIELMKYLCKLITPKNGTILDPFMGSGSTGVASKIENFNFIGIEIDENYFKIAEARINNIKVVNYLF